MATAIQAYAKSEFRFAIAEESTFGTAITTQTAFKELLITDIPQIDWGGVVRDEAKKSDGKRVLSNKDVFLQTAGGEYTVSVAGILTDNTADLLLYGVMQDLTGATPGEAATTPFAKVFEWDGSTTGVSSGYPSKFFTLNGYNPSTSEHWQVKSAIVKTLAINADPGTNGGRASFTATFYSGFAPTLTGLTVTPTDWTAPATDFYIFQNLNTKAVNGTTDNLVLGSFSISFENNVKRIGNDSSGGPQYYVYAGGGNDFVVTGELSAKYDNNTKDEIDSFLTNPQGGSAERQIYIRWGDGSADGTLLFDVNALYTGNSIDFGADTVMVSLPFSGVDDGTNEAVEVTIANAIDRAW